MGIDTYYTAFPNDRLAFKILVYGLFALETFRSILVSSDGFDTFATHLHDIDAFNRVRFYWLSAPVLGGIGVLFVTRGLSAIKLCFSGSHGTTFFRVSLEGPLTLLDTYTGCHFCEQLLYLFSTHE